MIPTLNERDNIARLLELLETALADVMWEVIFVDDDSRDGTAELVRSIARRDPRVRCIHRVGRRGLASACIEGLLASAAPYVAVMDADLQHDETLLPRMLQTLKDQPYDLVVGSRYAAGGEIGEFDPSRARLSGVATRLSRLICKADIADPMSGFFMVQREVFEGAVRSLSGQGFKILLDLIASSPRPLRIKELPFRFRTRQHGASKLDGMVAWEFGTMVADKLIGHVVPVRFLLFGLVGILGLAVHLSVLWTALNLPGLRFVVSQAAATVVAMTFNFFLNNIFTYRDQRLRGARLLWGLLSFYFACGLGAFANVGVADYMFAAGNQWWLAGACGAAVGSVWNYVVSSAITWKK